jgi:tetratricopeptide (TPR) repeat protein
LLFVVGLSSASGAEVVFRGVVVRDRLGGPPQAAVEVYAVGTAPTLSKTDGLFLMKFGGGAKSGDEVEFKVGADWAVVNFELMKTRLPSPGPATKVDLTVVVAKPSERAQRRAEFYGLRWAEDVERSYRKELSVLEAKLNLSEQERDKERARLERERDEALDRWKLVARQVGEATPETSGEGFTRAMQMLAKGDREGALQSLDAALLEDEALQAQGKVEDAVRAWQLRALLLEDRLDFDGASLAFEQAVKFAPGSFDAWLGLGIFNSSQNRLLRAREACEKAAALAGVTARSDHLAAANMVLGDISLAENRWGDARGNYEGALVIRRELAKTNPAVHLEDLGNTLYTLGRLSDEEGLWVDAQARYREAARIFLDSLKLGKGTKEYPAKFYRTVDSIADIVLRVGDRARDEGRMADARAEYEPALILYRTLAETGRLHYRQQLSRVLRSLGDFSRDEGRMADARANYEEALAIRRELARIDPLEYQEGLSVILMKIGDFARDEGRMADARGYYEEELAILRALAKANSEEQLGYLEDLAIALRAFGDFSRKEGRMGDARTKYREAIEAYQRLSAASPSSNQYKSIRYKKEINQLQESLTSVIP